MQEMKGKKKLIDNPIKQDAVLFRIELVIVASLIIVFNVSAIRNDNQGEIEGMLRTLTIIGAFMVPFVWLIIRPRWIRRRKSK